MKSGNSCAPHRAFACAAKSDDSGLLHDESHPRSEGERRLANCRHIVGALEQEAYGRGLDLHGLISAFDSRQARTNDVDGANYQPIETERHKVKILTIHASKGLEYPIVFVAGGFTEGRGDAVTTYRGADRRGGFDLAPNDAARAA